MKGKEEGGEGGGGKIARDIKLISVLLLLTANIYKELQGVTGKFCNLCGEKNLNMLGN